MEKTGTMMDTETWCCQRTGELDVLEQQAKRTRGSVREEMSTLVTSANRVFGENEMAQ